MLTIYDTPQIVSGHTVYVLPYTEKRRAELDAVNKDVQAFFNEQKDDTTWADIPLKKKAEFWERKARILWRTDKPYPRGFFESPEFEYPVLRAHEQLFMSALIYL